VQRRVAIALNSARQRRFDGAANGELSAGYPEISRIASELELSPFRRRTHRRRQQWHNCRGANATSNIYVLVCDSPSRRSELTLAK